MKPWNSKKSIAIESISHVERSLAKILNWSPVKIELNKNAEERYNYIGIKIISSSKLEHIQRQLHEKPFGWKSKDIIIKTAR